jgi:hypothetical protein
MKRFKFSFYSIIFALNIKFWIIKLLIFVTNKTLYLDAYFTIYVQR